MTTPSYQECLQTIYKLGRFGIKLELDTIRDMLHRLGDPQNRFNTVHVAGTNGKGSTATYIAAILQKAGFKTGVYTSPHLVRFNERISINGQEITNDEVVKAYEAVHASDTGKRKATYFEIATAMGFYHFAEAAVDWVVVETGMGGRFDATNVIFPKVSVITNLSIEHTEYLGKTIKALAYEKGGIIKPGIPVVTAVSQHSGLKTLSEIAKEKQADLYVYKKDFSSQKARSDESYTYHGLYKRFNELRKPLPGDHQKENMSLALAACELIFKKHRASDPRYDLTTSLVREGLSQARWPGRLEHVMKEPLVILDGAHNLHATKVLGKYLASFLKERSLTLVLGILDDKPYEKMMEFLVPLAGRVIITRAKIDRSLDPRVLKASAEKMAKGTVMVIDDVKDAVGHAVKTASKEDVICVAGSLYVVGEAKEKFDMDLEQSAKFV